MNLKNILQEEKITTSCTSCQICAVVCPTNAIKIEINEDGFYRPIIDNLKCIECEKCKKYCYKYDANIKNSEQHIEAWACKAKQKEVLENSTSGGVAYLLANLAVENGYNVLGVAYDYETNRAIAKITDKDVEQFRGSKYIQA